MSFASRYLPPAVCWSQPKPPLSTLPTDAISAFTMIGTSIWDYVFIQTCIFFLHLFAPFSILYSLTSWLLHPPFYIPRILQVFLALETLFYFAVYLPRRHYLQRPAKHPTISPEDRRILFRRCHDNIPDAQAYLEKWFLGAPAVEIRRENVKDFLRWAFFNTGELDPAYDDELEEYVGRIDELLGRKLEPGRGNARCLRLTIDKVDMLHRSLMWYFVSFLRPADVPGLVHLQ